MSVRRTVYRNASLAWDSFRKGWPVQSCKGNALAGTLAGLVLIASLMAASGHAPSATRHGPLHGTITRIDAPAWRLHMRSDTGRQMDLAVANIDAMRAVRAGEQVRVDIDENGVVLNIATAILTPRPVSYSRG